MPDKPSAGSGGRFRGAGSGPSTEESPDSMEGASSDPRTAAQLLGLIARVQALEGIQRVARLRAEAAEERTRVVVLDNDAATEEIARLEKENRTLRSEVAKLERAAGSPTDNPEQTKAIADLEKEVADLTAEVARLEQVITTLEADLAEPGPDRRPVTDLWKLKRNREHWQRAQTDFLEDDQRVIGGEQSIFFQINKDPESILGPKAKDLRVVIIAGLRDAVETVREFESA